MEASLFLFAPDSQKEAQFVQEMLLFLFSFFFIGIEKNEDINILDIYFFFFFFSFFDRIQCKDMGQINRFVERIYYRLDNC